MTRTEAFRAKLASPTLTHAMAAHNPMAAKLAERAGFDAIWAADSSTPRAAT
jgi:phosphoenolpyruvate phosphomutase